MSEPVACPYRGLTPYSEQDARFFFGRAEDTQLIVANMFSARVTVLFGPSGVGKSSILRAGAIRDLRRRQNSAIERGEQPDLLIVYFNTWQGNPVAWLRHTLVKEASALAGRTLNLPEGGSLADLLTSITNTLEVDVMLLLDQFEEYFRYETRFGGADSFAMQFAEAVGRNGLPVSFVLSLREDSLAELDRFKSLIPNLFTNWYRLDRLGLAAAEQAIRGPVEEYNKLPASERRHSDAIALDDGLAAEVLRQVRTGAVVIGDGGRGKAREEKASIETPYLQLVLTELWDEELSAGSATLRVETLRRLGGAAAIVGRHVDTVLGALTPGERQLCARMFDYLVTDSGAKIAYRARDLAEKAEVDEMSMQTLLGKLAEGDKRIVTTVAPAPDHPSEPQYEIYHDSLSRAVIAWRRRYMESRQRRKLALKLAPVAAALVLALLAFGVYQKSEAQTAEAQAERSKLFELEARQSQLAAEAETLALQLSKLQGERQGESEDYQRLKAQLAKRNEEAARYGKEAHLLGNQIAQQAPSSGSAAAQLDKRLELETARANRAELERTQALAELKQLREERDGLMRRMDQVRQAPASSEQASCLLEQVRVVEDGSTGETRWRFQITIRPVTGKTVSVDLPLTLDDRQRPLVVVGRSWPVAVDPVSPLVHIEISAQQMDGRKGSTVATGYVDSGRTRSVALVMPKPSDGTMIFDFALQPLARSK